MAKRWAHGSAKGQLALVGLFLLIQLAAASAQGQIPVTSCETYIHDPGDYVLANNLSDCARFGIVITTHARLNLDGHTISGKGAFSGIYVDSGDVDITGPGTISNFESGVMVASGGGVVRVTQVSSTGNTGVGFLAPFGATVIFQQNTSTDNKSWGFSVISVGSELRDNTATGNKSGFNIDGVRNQVIHNTATNNDDYGIAAGGADNVIHDNTASDNGRDDLYDFTDCRNLWSDNTFHTANRGCIH